MQYTHIVLLFGIGFHSEIERTSAQSVQIHPTTHSEEAMGTRSRLRVECNVHSTRLRSPDLACKVRGRKERSIEGRNKQQTP